MATMFLFRNRFIGIALFCLLLGGGAPPALAYVPAPEDLFTQWALQVPDAERAILELRTVVFDASAASPPAESSEGSEPEWPVLEEQSFTQRVYWMRKRLVAVETFSLGGVPLHVYIDEGVDQGRGIVSRDLSNRHFDPLDVLHPYLPFLGGTAADWRAGFAEWGIVPAQVDLVPLGKGRLWYRLGEDDASALLSPGHLRLAGLDTYISGGNAPLLLSVRFSEAAVVAGESEAQQQPLHIPHATVVSLDERPLKLIKVLRMLVDPPLSAFPLQRLRSGRLTTPVRTGTLSGRVP